MIDRLYLVGSSMIAMRMRTRDPAGEDNRGTAGGGSKVSSGRTTPMSHSAKKRQMTPEEFLHRITGVPVITSIFLLATLF